MTTDIEVSKPSNAAQRARRYRPGARMEILAVLNVEVTKTISTCLYG